MKRAGWLLLLLGVFAFAQNKQLLYDFKEVPQALLLNPGMEVDNYRWHAGIPLVSHFHLNVGSSGVSVYDLFANDGVDFNTKLRNTIFKLEREDNWAFNQQLEIFYGGFRPHDYSKVYYSFGMYQEADFVFYYPEDLVELAYEGNGGRNINRGYDLGDLSFKGELLTALHFGFNKRVNEKFTFGFRGKLYSSILNFKSTNNSGVFRTIPGRDNFYNHLVIADLSLQTSGYASLRDLENTGQSDWNAKAISELRGRALFSGNMGLGVDAGFTYRPSDQWTVTASVQDFGFIRHAKDVESYKIDTSYNLEGINLLFPGVTSGQDVDEYWQSILDDLDEQFTIDTISSPYTAWRSMKLHSSLRYDFGKRSKNGDECDCKSGNNDYVNGVGAQLYAIGRPRTPQVALTAFYYRRLFDFLSLKGTYTIDSYSKTNIGLGMSAHLGNFNLYLMADNLLEYQNLAAANQASIQFGFNFIVPQRK